MVILPSRFKVLYDQCFSMFSIASYFALKMFSSMSMRLHIIVTPRIFISFTQSKTIVYVVGLASSLLWTKIIVCVLSLLILSSEMFPKLSIMSVNPCRLFTEFSILKVISSANPSLFIVTSLKGFRLYVTMKGLTVSAVLFFY